MIPVNKSLKDSNKNFEEYLKKMKENDDYDTDKSIFVKILSDYIKALDVDYPIMSSPNFTKAEKDIMNNYIVSELKCIKMEVLLYKAYGKGDKDKFAEYENKVNELQPKSDEAMKELVKLEERIYNTK